MPYTVNCEIKREVRHLYFKYFQVLMYFTAPLKLALVKMTLPQISGKHMLVSCEINLLDHAGAGKNQNANDKPCPEESMFSSHSAADSTVREGVRDSCISTITGKKGEITLKF